LKHLLKMQQNKSEFVKEFHQKQVLNVKAY